MFDVRLERALGNMSTVRTVDEMAQLRSWNAQIREGETKFRVYFGIQPDGSGSHIFWVNARTRADAMVKAEKMLRDMFKDVPDDEMKAKFGGTLDYNLVALDVEPEDDSKPSSFNERDAKSLGNPKTRQAVEDYLNANPAGYAWNFLILDKAILGDIAEVPIDRNDALANYIENTFPDVEMKGAVTFVKLGTTGDALDADMLIHTVGHAAMGHRYNRNQYRDAGVILKGFAWDIMGMAGKTPDGPRVPDQILWNGEAAIIWVLSQFLHFKAAKNTLLQSDESISAHKRAVYQKRSLPDLGEVIHEMFSIFVKKDKVKLSPNSLCVFTKDDRIRDAVIAKASRTEERMNELFRIVLDNLVDEVIVDD